MQFKFAEIQQQIPIGLTKKIEAKKICFKHRVFRQDTTYIATVALVDIKVHTTACLAKWNADQTFRIDDFIHRFRFWGQIYYFLFIKMAYIPVFKA